MSTGSGNAHICETHPQRVPVPKAPREWVEVGPEARVLEARKLVTVKRQSEERLLGLPEVWA